MTTECAMCSLWQDDARPLFPGKAAVPGVRMAIRALLPAFPFGGFIRQQSEWLYSLRGMFSGAHLRSGLF
jgi:hypothetical protein